ncbi:MAG: type II toxin-antitoxin system PemK/MazF family toxin [Verrucomicrobia bacterium]|nr:type II toxin-antitoxin system PemK/MazF family toxin [Verrucomicrobiota bacterium]
MKRYEIYWARLDPVEGSELGKTRPCVIVSLDALNAALPTVVVCPLTTVRRPGWRTRLAVTSAGKPADICADQVRVVNKTRLTRKIGALKSDDAAALRELLTEMYGEE